MINFGLSEKRTIHLAQHIPTILYYSSQGRKYRLVIDNRWRDNRWRYSLLFFYRISIRLYFLTIDFQLYGWNYRL